MSVTKPSATGGTGFCAFPKFGSDQVAGAANGGFVRRTSFGCTAANVCFEPLLDIGLNRLLKHGAGIAVQHEAAFHSTTDVQG